MPYRTKRITLMPWVGGVNTTLDPATISPSELTKAENLLFGVRGSRRMRDGINSNWDSATPGSVNIIAGLDYWYNTPRVNVKVGLGDNKTFYSWTNSGTQSAPALASQAVTFTNASAVVTATAHGFSQNEPIVFSGGSLPSNVTAGVTYYVIQTLTAGVVDVNQFNIGTTPFFLPLGTQSAGNVVTAASSGSGTGAPLAWTGTPTLASMITFNNRVIFGCNGGNTPRKYDPNQGVVRSLGGNPPQGYSFCQYLGRLWSNDYANPDRLQYTTTGNHEEWQGIGDSGSLDIGVGDGDPVGIMGMFPFQGILYVAKLTKLYAILNSAPENFQVQLVSNGIGLIGPNAYATVDQDDILFISQRGIHSLVGTIAAGDDESKYLSRPIQTTFNTNWIKSRLSRIWARYLSTINSIAIAVSDTNYSGSSSYNNAIWLYNIPLKSWYTWPNVICQCLFVGDDSDAKRFYLGGNNTRLAKAFNGTNYDITSGGTNQDITMNVKTGVIYADENPFTVRGYKKFSLIYGPQGTHTINVAFKIDNYSTQSMAFSQTQTGGVLGVSFYLGQSALGYSFVTGPYQQGVDGYGRGFQVTITQSGQQANIDIQGFSVEYEELGPAQETITSG